MGKPFKTYRVRYHQEQYIPEYRFIYTKWCSYKHQGEYIWFKTPDAAIDYIRQQTESRVFVELYEEQG